VGYWEGIVRLGRIEDTSLIAGLPDGSQGIVERLQYGG
jgi:hypothetical protein